MSAQIGGAGDPGRVGRASEVEPAAPDASVAAAAAGSGSAAAAPRTRRARSSGLAGGMLEAALGAAQAGGGAADKAAATLVETYRSAIEPPATAATYEAAFTAADGAVRRALGAGRPLAEALAAGATEVWRRHPSDAAPGGLALSADSFAAAGLVAEGSPEYDALDTALLDLDGRFEREMGFFQMAAAAGGATPEAVAASYYRSLDADPRGGPARALAATAGEHMRGARTASLAGLGDALRLAPYAERSAVAAAVLRATGASDRDAARQALAGLESMPAAARDAALRAFDGARGSLAAALGAAADAAVPFPREEGSPGIASILDLHLLAPTETARAAAAIGDADARGATEAALAGLAESARAPASFLTDHRRRLAEGAPFADEVIRAAGALPDRSRSANFGLDAERLADLAAGLPPARRREAGEALLRSQGVSAADFAWTRLTAESSASRSELSRGRQALDAALSSGASLAEALSKGLTGAGVQAPYSLEEYEDALIPIGIVDAEEARRLSEAARAGSGGLAADVGLLAGPFGAREAQAVADRLAGRPVSTAAEALEAMLDALGPRPAGAAPVAMDAADVGDLGVAPDRLSALARRLYARAGVPLEAVAREALAGDALSPSPAADAPGALAAFDRAARGGGGVRAAVEAAIREGGIRDEGVLETLRRRGALDPAEVAALRKILRGEA